jgi:N-acetylglucosaminyldiphosphoundecaprenol N-acetyl-beta-D-mannosaminyltransferase
LWAHYAKALRPSRIVATVGAAFDFHAGTKRQAPDWIQRAGLEWSFRLLSEPRRLWRRYLIGNARFVAAVAKDRITANASR